jgi:hypothetical protein
MRNLKFHQYYKEQLQLKFADAEPNYEMLIAKADDSLDITKQLKQWFSHAGVAKLLSIEEVGRKPRNTMVSFPMSPLFSIIRNAITYRSHFKGW